MELENRYWIMYKAAFKHIDLTDYEKTEIKKLYGDEGRAKIFDKAEKKKIIPATAMLMCKLGIDDEYWKAVSDEYRIRNERVVESLNSAYSELRTGGVTRIGVVENFGALLASGQDLAMFGSGDVDNYADMAEKDKIYYVFKEMGYTLDEHCSGSILVSTSFRNETVLPKNFYLSINWDVTCRTALPCLTAKGPFVDWSNSRTYKNTSILIPTPEALMYICMMHIAVHGFCKAPDIRLYYDIANAYGDEIDWNLIEKWAVRDKMCVRISTAAFLSNRLLGVKTPDRIMNLGSSKLRKKLLSIVYDSQGNNLRNHPNRLDELRIDAFSDDRGGLHGLISILFPDSNWIERRYGSKTLGHILHLKNLI
ncbi:MAG: nucleotidyltransferase family protein [Oscillospiraceae bacterium]|nr:nucleotidyltransferase family protein [Oscillospiraceae bacterium]